LSEFTQFTSSFFAELLHSEQVNILFSYLGMAFTETQATICLGIFDYIGLYLSQELLIIYLYTN